MSPSRRIFRSAAQTSYPAARAAAESRRGPGRGGPEEPGPGGAAGVLHGAPGPHRRRHCSGRGRGQRECLRGPAGGPADLRGAAGGRHRQGAARPAGAGHLRRPGWRGLPGGGHRGRGHGPIQAGSVELESFGSVNVFSQSTGRSVPVEQVATAPPGRSQTPAKGQRPHLVYRDGAPCS